MFIKIKLSKSKIVCIVSLAVLTALLLIEMFSNGTVLPKGADLADRKAFAAKLGYKINQEKQITADVVIPETFNKTYNNYNKIQKKAGFDLYSYRGQQVKMFSYPLCDNADVYMNLLVLDGKIIGGDVSSIENGGYTLPLTIKSNSGSENNADNAAG